MGKNRTLIEEKQNINTLIFKNQVVHVSIDQEGTKYISVTDEETEAQRGLSHVLEGEAHL